MSRTENSLALKWGTLKGYNFTDAACIAAMERLLETPRSMSAMLQEDSPEQKQLLCEVIDAVSAVGGEIYNDWSGEDMTAEHAKQYIMTYGKS